MPINLQFNEADVPFLKEFYLNKKNELYKQANDVDRILSQLENTTKSPLVAPATKTTTRSAMGDTTVYNNNWPWIKKITCLIGENGGSATTSELAELLFIHEPKLIDKRKKQIASMSSVLSSNSKEGGRFTKAPNDRGVSVYGLK